MAQKNSKSKSGKPVLSEKERYDNDPVFVKKRLAAIAFFEKAGYPPGVKVNGTKTKAGTQKK